MIRARLTPLLACLFLSAPAQLFSQCVMCRESVAASRGPGQGDLALGFNWGILFLLGTLMLLLGGVAGLVVYTAKCSAPAAVCASPQAATAQRDAELNPSRGR